MLIKSYLTDVELPTRLHWHPKFEI